MISHNSEQIKYFHERLRSRRLKLLLNGVRSLLRVCHPHLRKDQRFEEVAIPKTYWTQDSDVATRIHKTGNRKVNMTPSNPSLTWRLRTGVVGGDSGIIYADD